MGKLNNELCSFINRSEVFAELFNVDVYGGQKVVSRENLLDAQRTYGEALPDRYGKKRKKLRERDVVKALCRNGRLVRLAVENQAELNYCMPLRCLEYDVEDFARQLRRLKRHYKQEGGLPQTAEYLSGIKASDKLVPNITILLYHGAGKWDAAERLWDMIDLDALDEKLKEIHMDYRLHVVNLTELDENLLQTGLKELVGMLKRAGNKEKMRQFMQENEERFRDMDNELYDLICTMLGLKELVKRKETCKNQGKETYNMCIAFQEMMQDSKEAGKKIGIRQGEEKLGALICRMYQEGRGEEVPKAARSVRFRNQLYREYGI